VGIGASAGGLDAFKQLIKAIPVDSGMAFILVQHLDPSHESILTELLQKITLIPIAEIKDNVCVEPDHIYVIPPNKMLTATDGILKLETRTPHQKSLSIDTFFTSLVEVHQGHAIGVVLSGTGKDGTIGLRAIKEGGGITFAQHPQTAAFKEMPQNAINANVVDFILTPEGIVSQLLNLGNTAKDHRQEQENNKKVNPEEGFHRQILSLLDRQKGVDFTYYKQTTIRRRILRRMVLRNLAKIEDYLHYLERNLTEVDALFNDILIPVTEFFRDEKSFRTLSETALPALSKNKTASDFLRIWVVGCSTGQEAYSIAICISEFFEYQKDHCKIQIFATDISEVAIEQARSGSYSRNEVAGISEERLTRYFTKNEGGFQVNKMLRDLCVFAAHNILTNPPFAGINLISCRNVLIYMDAFLQRKAMATFHYALNEKGILLLGKSESIGNSSDLFTPFSEFDKLYQRKSVPGRFIHVAAKRKLDILANGPSKLIKESRPNDDFQKSADDMVLGKYPDGVIVNDQMEILQFRGSTGDWLESAPGKPSLNVLKMAKPDLVLDLRNAVHKVKITRQPYIKEKISIQINGWKKLVTIEVIPLLNTINLYYLILFKNTEETFETVSKKAAGQKLRHNLHQVRSLQLEKELSQTRDDMRTITEDQEAGNEELLSANEELLSGSEELRSLNEELEISKEELQSTVEELSVANQELAFRNEQLNHSRKYAEAIVTTIREPLIVLDKDLRVKSANSSFYRTFQTSEKDVEGVLFYELGNGKWDIPELRRILQKTIAENSFYESFEVQRNFASVGDRVMLLNARKIFSDGSSEHLILLVIEDITERRILEDSLKKNADYVKAILESSPQITSTAASGGAITYFNQYFLDYSGLTLTESIEWGWLKIVHPSMKEAVTKAWLHAMTTGEDFYQELKLKRFDGAYRWHISRAVAIRNDQGVISSWVGTMSDIHEQKMFSEELEKKVKERTQLLHESNIELEHSNKNLEQFAFIASHDLQEPLRKIKTFSNMLSDNFSDKLPGEGIKLINKIHSSSDRMSVLIRDVLNFSRIENTEIAFVSADLNEILNNVLGDFTLLINEKNAIVQQEKLFTMEVIPLQINQLFYNLISNSLKFTQEGVQPVITISSRQLTLVELSKYPELNHAIPHCEILFADNGIGFEEKFTEKIFLIFQRLHTREQFSGTGIGLALCKKIVLNHNGKIFGEAKLNAGALFHIILPLKHSQGVDLLPGYVE
jgi:two-component system CheB/CheR fusion protein